MDPSLRPITALVTGASRGIGAGIALQLANRGVRLALHYHSNQSAIEQVLAQLPGEGHVACRADLGDSGSALRLWNDAQTLIGDVDVLVNNAGIFIDHPPLSTDFDQWRSTWDRTLSTNLIGPAHLSMLAAQAMSARAPRSALFGRGRIVNISSRGAFRGEPDAPAYGASKAGLNALGQSLAKALGPREIYVFSIAPGWVGTEMATAHLAGPDGPAILAQPPLGRINGVSEVAAAAVYCALEAPGAMTGGVIDVNGASYLRS